MISHIKEYGLKIKHNYHKLTNANQLKPSRTNTDGTRYMEKKPGCRDTQIVVRTEQTPSSFCRLERNETKPALQSFSNIGHHANGGRREAAAAQTTCRRHNLAEVRHSGCQLATRQDVTRPVELFLQATRHGRRRRRVGDDDDGVLGADGSGPLHGGLLVGVVGTASGGGGSHMVVGLGPGGALRRRRRCHMKQKAGSED